MWQSDPLFRPSEVTVESNEVLGASRWFDSANFQFSHTHTPRLASISDQTVQVGTEVTLVLENVLLPSHSRALQKRPEDVTALSVAASGGAAEEVYDFSADGVMHPFTPPGDGLESGGDK